MTAKDLAQSIGRRGTLTVDSLTLTVDIRDARQVFGRVDYLVTPVDGGGEQWVSSDRVKEEG